MKQKALPSWFGKRLSLFCLHRYISLLIQQISNVASEYCLLRFDRHMFSIFILEPKPITLVMASKLGCDLYHPSLGLGTKYEIRPIKITNPRLDGSPILSKHFMPTQDSSPPFWVQVPCRPLTYWFKRIVPSLISSFDQTGTIPKVVHEFLIW